MISQNNLKVMQFPSKYLQGENAIELLPEMLGRLGSSHLILVTRSQKELTEKVMNGKASVELFGGECTFAEIDRIIKIARDIKAESITAVGGGKVIDTAKSAGEKLGIPTVIVPTICATDAPCSGVAVIYNEDGVFAKTEYLRQNPFAVLVDTAIISQAPQRFIVSGMGDAFATYLEAIACDETCSPNECKNGGLRTTSAMMLCRLCMDMLFEYGEQAKKDAGKGCVTQAIEKITEANILLSGLGFESAGLGMCHAVANALTFAPETHSMYHGEKVAFGCLVELEIYDPLEIKEKTFKFFSAIGLPVTLADLNITENTDELISVFAEDIARNDPSQYSHHEPYDVTAEKVAAAFRAADEDGKKYRKTAK